MPVRYSKKLEALPHYEGGMDIERARRTYEASDVIKLASNESPWGPHPAVLEAVAKAAAAANRYPDQYAALLRGRLSDRFDVPPAGIAVSNGSCELLLAGAMALCEPGAEIVHYGGQSTGQATARTQIAFQRSKLRYFRKFHGRAQAEILRLDLLLQYVWQLGLEAVKSLLGHKRPLRRERMRAYLQALRSGLKVE